MVNSDSCAPRVWAGSLTGRTNKHLAVASTTRANCLDACRVQLAVESSAPHVMGTRAVGGACQRRVATHQRGVCRQPQHLRTAGTTKPSRTPSRTTGFPGRPIIALRPTALPSGAFPAALRLCKTFAPSPCPRPQARPDRDRPPMHRRW